MLPDILQKKRQAFVLWAPEAPLPFIPQLVLGLFVPGNPPGFNLLQQLNLFQIQPGLWSVDAAACGLVNGQVYHYWFQLNPGLQITDPFAYCTDWRLTSGNVDESRQYPASVIKFSNGQLVPCDPGGEEPNWQNDPALNTLPANNKLVIYELPTAWTRSSPDGDLELGAGTFRDALALIDPHATGANFQGHPVLGPGRSYLKELGVNALELLPPADSFVVREWGYATSHYLAPDFDLGFPRNHSSPTANTDLTSLVKACHLAGMRFFADMVMAFSTGGVLRSLDYNAFHIYPPNNPGDPDENQSGNQGQRNAFGGDLFRYSHTVPQVMYDPVTGQNLPNLIPARQFMQVYLARWMNDFRIDGIRMDSVNNVANWDFLQEFKDAARSTWAKRGGSGDTFLVVGEELSVPKDLLYQSRLDGLWNEDFRYLLRSAILGHSHDSESNFENTVRSLIDCRRRGFTDGSQSINYVTTHDVENYEGVRLFNFLLNHGITDTEPRIKLAFSCLMTAVGIPMFLAGEEFADSHDQIPRHPYKQVDPVNFNRLNDPWRQNVLTHVKRLIALRKQAAALCVNDTEFIHTDFTDGRRVMAWVRGHRGVHDPVVVVANFSDYTSGLQYGINGWPVATGRNWREVTQDRLVAPSLAGNEQIFPWEAKVYTLF